MASARRKRVDRDLERFIEQAVRQLQLRVFQILTSESPVDTGFFRAGWSPSVGAPSRDKPTTRPKDRAAAESQASSLLGQHTQEAANIAATYRLASGAVFIANNVRYGIYLNAGSSAQAPAMFVERSIQQGIVATNRSLGQTVFRAGF